MRQLIVQLCVAFGVIFGGQQASAGAIFSLDFSYANRVFNGCLPPPCYEAECTPTPCPPFELVPYSEEGSGTITFPGLTSLDSGPDLQLSFFGPPALNFTEADILSISWEIATDLKTLTSLELELRTNPGCIEGASCSYSAAYINIADNVGEWSATFYSCKNYLCFMPEPILGYRLVKASPDSDIPVPTSMALIGLALASLGWSRFRRIT